MYASFNGNEDIVKLLLEQEGIDVNAQNNIYFINFGFQRNIQKLYSIFWTALMYAAFIGHEEIVKLLLEHEGIDVNIMNIYIIIFIIQIDNLKFQNIIWKLFKIFQTALLLAVEYGSLEISSILCMNEGIVLNEEDVYSFFSVIISMF